MEDIIDTMQNIIDMMKIVKDDMENQLQQQQEQSQQFTKLDFETPQMLCKINALNMTHQCNDGGLNDLESDKTHNYNETELHDIRTKSDDLNVIDKQSNGIILYELKVINKSKQIIITNNHEKGYHNNSMLILYLRTGNIVLHHDVKTDKYKSALSDQQIIIQVSVILLSISLHKLPLG